jgi:transposase
MYIPKTRARATIPLDIEKIDVLASEQKATGEIIITIESQQVGTECRVCGRKISKFYGTDHKWVDLRHRSILGHPVYIRLRPKRYQCSCSHKPTTSQRLDWYEVKSPHTKAYDEHLMLQLVNSTIADVSQKENVGYDAVAGALKRRVQSSIDWTAVEELSVLGIDEIALKKGRKNYAAIISTRQANEQVKVLAVLPDRKKKTVRQFLEMIPKHLRATMKTVCTDMWDGYVNAVEEFAAAYEDVSVEIVVDRFHVAKNYRDCVDTLRKKECRRLKMELSDEEYEAIKGIMWIVRKNNKDLTLEERKRLRLLFSYAPDLKAAYTFREELTAIFEQHLSREEALRRLRVWALKVKQSGLKCFNSFLKTLSNWLDKIANYFTARLNSGFVEGLNNKVKTLKRRCYGIQNVIHLFQRIFLDTEGYYHFA